tara:strand:- start:792 stop:2003 length:1212 start_codon:yes stop_codon:yes gene_type:complete
MRLGYKHDIQSDAIADRYWNNTVLPLLANGSLEHAINGTYAYPNRIGLYPGINCQFFCTFCGRNYNAKYSKSVADESFTTFQKVIDEDPKTGPWEDRFRISGGLEPLTNPHIGNIISYGNDRGFKMQMYTNGYALTPKFLDKQMGILDLEVMRVSLYGHNETSYANVTKNNKGYSRVVKNLKDFCKVIDTTDSNIKLGVNWIILPGHSGDLISVFEMIREINSVSNTKISFITLREDFSQSNNYISDIERDELHKTFCLIEQMCGRDNALTDLHIDYGYALHPVRHGFNTGPLKMATYNQLGKHGFPQIATAVDSIGSLYVYHETGFLERPGSERYIIGNTNENTAEEIVKNFLESGGIKPLPFDVGFLDAFDHTVTLLINESKEYIKQGLNWKEALEEKWKR